MKSKHVQSVRLPVVCALALIAAAAAGCTEAETRSDGALAVQPGAPATLAPQHFRATVYEVRIPPEMIGTLDAKALEAKAHDVAITLPKPEDPTAFLKALETIGPTKALYQVDQSVNPAMDTINIGERVPFVTSSAIVTSSGAQRNTIQYQQVGAIFRFSSNPAGSSGRRIDLRQEVDVSGVTDSGVAIAPGVQAIAIRSCIMHVTGPVELKRPFVFLSADASVKDAEGKAVAYICRAVLGEP